MKVAISARNFVFDGCKAVELLKNNGFEVVDLSNKNFKSEAEYFEAIKDADAIINAFELMSAKLLEKCKKLKVISVRGVGYDYIDSSSCEKLGISITRTVGTVGEAVSEQVIAYILHFSREIERLNSFMQSGEWNRIMTEGAYGKTIGIIGFGEIGSSIAKKADALGMKIIYNCKNKKNVPYDFVDIKTLLKMSDYVVLALPLSIKTKNLIDENALSLMKKNAVLINVARAGIVDTLALKNAVENGIIKGAAVDVFENEPCVNSPLRNVENIILTPHTAPFTKKNFIDMNTLAAENIINFFDETIDKKYLV
ncbi:MAG: 3-phosphoglycerate dehydrogenase [Eubacterium sp.]|nr:3-phosphoglycerate dehydrogenase [Eubacterium sp.]